MKRTILTVNENHGDPPLKKAVGEIIRRISETLPDLREPVSMYLAGGIAVNFYTGYRSTEPRFSLPNEAGNRHVPLDVAVGSWLR